MANERMSGPPVRKPNSAHPARMFTRSLAASVDRSPSSVRAPTNQRHWNSRLHPRGLSRAYPGTGYVPGNWALGSWACQSDMNDDARRILSFFFFFASSHRIYPFAQAARKLSLGCAASPSRLESAQPAVINQTRELRDGEACRLTYKPGGIARSTPISPLTSYRYKWATPSCCSSPSAGETCNPHQGNSRVLTSKRSLPPPKKKGPEKEKTPRYLALTRIQSPPNRRRHNAL